MSNLINLIKFLKDNYWTKSVTEAKFTIFYGIVLVCSFIIWLIYYVYSKGGIKAMFKNGKIAKINADVELKRAELNLKKAKAELKKFEIEDRIRQRENKIREIDAINKQIAQLEENIPYTLDESLKAEYTKKVCDLKKNKEELLKSF